MPPTLPRILCAVLALSAPRALAQSSTFVGTVINAVSRHPVPDVVITATSPNLEGEQTVVTDAQGNYRIPRLPPGVYTLRFEKEQYKPYGRSDIQLRLNRTRRVDVELIPEGMLGEVAAPFGTTPELHASSTATGVTVDQEFVKRIAVSRSSASSPGSVGNASGAATSGSTSPENGYVVDGLSFASASPSLEQAARVHGIYSSVPPMQPMSPAPWPQPVSVPSYSPPPPRLMPINGARFFDMYFKGYGVNPTVNTEEEPFSTFSVDTDTASYAMTRAYLERSALPDEAAVRVEEFVNTFDYGYTHPGNAPFGLHVEGFPSPVRKGYQVLRIGMKTQEVAQSRRKPSHLVFVIDTSGSMGGESRLGLVKRALRLLVDALDERDRVSLVDYGTDARQVLPPTSIADKSRLLSAIDGLEVDGSTNAQAGMELGYRIAAKHLIPGGINRVILCSDGVANNGVTSADGIWARVKEHASRGITLSTVGFGMGNYNDVLMERLAQVGEGQYAYVDRLKEAQRIFVENLGGTLQVVAKDVKLQVEFDEKSVSLYRLLGYENRMLTKEQFRDDAVDAGEVGAGHAVTALYEVKLRPSAERVGTLRIRYKAPEGGDSKELELPLPLTSLRPSFAKAAPATRLAYVAAAFAEKLRGSYWTRPLTYEALAELWDGVGAPLAKREDVQELGQLIRKAADLDKRKDRFEEFAPRDAMDFDRPPAPPESKTADTPETPPTP
ncbi:von Willebrand factor type A domain-containing protein [Myxococcus sp. K15C18031901]|uniref:YfbK domain-containing protein n=1 Tax=Myxococcus dinghuensis TaxID=2906761 RepID=UPI0020A81A70|nr:von Willebrand factor type A domain-containing protein [Myxococcus dinghuensis]MCP3103043.1 von Willebrand factor type A domain-containing protein [Myxococcus dinghuensis]